jgi:hypothetical protein
MLRQGVLLKTFSSATYCLAVAVTFREKAWGEFPDAGISDGCMLGMVRLALASPATPDRSGIAHQDRRML